MGKCLNCQINAFLKRKLEVLLLISGGSCFSVLPFIKSSILKPKETITVLDERYDPGKVSSNFAQLKKTRFYQKAKKFGCHFIDTTVRLGETKEKLAFRFEQALRKWRDRYPKGKIIAIMGMGEDGHTSGIMPFPESEWKFRQLFMNNSWIAAYDASDKNELPLRVTTTITFLKMIDCAFVYVCGQKKHRSFLQFKKDNKNIHQFPAAVLKEMKYTKIYTDIK